MLKTDGDNPVWADDLDTKVNSVAKDDGKVFTGLKNHTTVSRTDVAALKLNGFTASKDAEGGITSEDTIGTSLTKLGEALAKKTNADAPVHADDADKLGGFGAKQYLKSNGDGSSVTVTYSEPTTHTEPKSGGTLSLIIGRIIKWIRSLTAADVGAVAKAGDTMTGHLKFKLGDRTGTPLTILPASGTNGDALLIGNGGLTVVGGGEFSTSWVGNFTEESPAVVDGFVTPGVEHLILGADQTIRMYVAGNTIANRRYVKLATGLEFHPDTAKAGSLGIASLPWGKAFVDNIVAGMISSGFFEPQPLTTDADIDTLLTPGMYAAQSASIAAALKNSPVGTSFTLFVFKPYALMKSVNYATQLLIPIATNANGMEIYLRNINGTTIGEWGYTCMRPKDQPVPISKGGTGGKTAAAALDALGAWSSVAKYYAAAAAIPADSLEAGVFLLNLGQDATLKAAFSKAESYAFILSSAYAGRENTRRRFQIAIGYAGGELLVRTTVDTSGNWTNWTNYFQTSGLGYANKTLITSSADLNGYIKPGTYLCTSNTISATVLNKPALMGNYAFTMEVDHVATSSENSMAYKIQRLTSYQGYKFWRVSNSSTTVWGPWISDHSISGYFNISSVPVGKSVQQTVVLPASIGAVPSLRISVRQSTAGLKAYGKIISRTSSSFVVEVWHENTSAVTIGVDWEASFPTTTTV